MKSVVNEYVECGIDEEETNRNVVVTEMNSRKRVKYLISY